MNETLAQAFKKLDTDYIKKLFVRLAPIPAGFLFIWCAKLRPSLTDDLYSNEIYRYTSMVTGFFGDLFPFSLAEVLIISFSLYMVFLLVRLIVRLKKYTNRAEILKTASLNLALLVSCLYLGFALTCAPNYYRLTFAEHSGLTLRPSSAAELSALCEELIGEANHAKEEAASYHGIMTLTETTMFEVAEKAQTVFNALSETYPFLGQAQRPPKPLNLSWVLSYLDLSGFYFPYTSESNVNVDMPHVDIPSTMCHELAHSVGFMREDEANFISYLACVNSGVPEFRYSGLKLALTYSMNQLYAADQEEYYRLRALYSDVLNADYANVSAYWSQFDTPVADVSNAVNNAYLKSNSQEDGVKSYGRMVDLLLADYRVRHGLE